MTVILSILSHGFCGSGRGSAGQSEGRSLETLPADAGNGDGPGAGAPGPGQASLSLSLSLSPH